MKAGDEVPAGDNEMYVLCPFCDGMAERICSCCGKYHECGCCEGSGIMKKDEYRQTIVPSDAELQRREGK